MLEVKNISKIYKSKNSNETQALNGVNINFNSIGLTFILGKSGCGKSTLLNIMGGLDTPTSGEIIFKGKSFKSFRDSDYDSYRNTSVGFIFQEYNLVEKYNVYDNVAYSLKLQSKNFDEKIVFDVLDKVGLTDLSQRKVNELSGGQKQRVAIARALVKNPSIILADEPTGNLDSENSKMIFEILKKLSSERLVIIVSHDEESAITYGDRIIKLEDGIVISDSNPPILNFNDNYSIKKNHLPFKEAFRFSIKNLFGHKLKLFFSIILISFALSFFGFSITQKYLKSNNEIARIIKDFNVNYINVEKLSNRIAKCAFDGYWRNCYDIGKYTEEEINQLSAKNDIKINIRYKNLINNVKLNVIEANDNVLNYYLSDCKNINTFSELKKENFDFKLIGSIPNSLDEIVIIKPIADYIINYGAYVYSEDEIYKPNNYNEIINDKKYIRFGDGKVRISGIINDDLSEFEPLKNITIDERLEDLSLENKKLVEKYNYKYPVKFYALEGFKNKIIDSQKSSLRFFKYTNDPEESLSQLKLFEPMKVYTEDGYINMQNLEENSIIVNSYYLDKISNGEFSKKMNDYIINGKDLNPSKSSDEYRTEFISKYIKENDITNKNIPLNLVKIFLEDNEENTNYVFLKIGGVVLGETEFYTNENTLNQNNDETYNMELYILTKDINNYDVLFKNYPKDGAKYILANKFIYSISDYEFSMKVFAKYLIIINLIFSLFAMLLLFNFIGLSITDNKKEIGILRALGTTKKDVSKIYSIQGLLITFISYIISIVLIIIYSLGENNILLSDYLREVFNLKIFGITFITLIIMLLFSVIVVLLSSLSVSLRIAKMEPIDAINNK